MIKYKSTRGGVENVGFAEAALSGLAPDGGLFVPDRIPQLPESFWQEWLDWSDHEIATEVLHPYLEEAFSREELAEMIEDAFNFPFPVKPVSPEVNTLELFHGPTGAFKDIGARFMARCLSKLSKGQETVILVATSGDTGGAVAHGFADVPGIKVRVLFPKGKVSQYQEYQMTSMGNNIEAIEVDGTFDDCQRLVKKAFQDQGLRNQLTLSSANSINIARLLPQMVYYFFGIKQLIEKEQWPPVVVAVPSGNLGNLTAGLMAWKMGLPIKRFIAGHNDNRTFPDFLSGENYRERDSIETVANAMDVGAPSNFERIASLFNGDMNELRLHVSGRSYTNSEVLSQIGLCYKNHGYLLDPHGAIGKLALDESLQAHENGLFLETASPTKFIQVIRRVLPDYTLPYVDMSECRKTQIRNNYRELVSLLTD